MAQLGTPLKIIQSENFFFDCYLHHISIKMVCHMQLQIINKEFKIQWTSKNPAKIG